MDFNQVSLNKAILNIGTPGDTGLTLNKGEVLKGVVQSIREDGMVMLSLKGRIIEAVTEVMVKPGQQLMLMVDEFKDGKTFLKVVSPTLMGEAENTNIAVNLMNMGITPSQESVMIARKLLQHNLPVNQNNLNQMSRLVAMLGTGDAKNLELAAFALSRGLIAKPQLQALAQFVNGKTNIAQLIPILQEMVSVLEQGTTPNPGSTRSDSRGGAVLKEMASSLIPAQEAGVSNSAMIRSNTVEGTGLSRLPGGTNVNSAIQAAPLTEGQGPEMLTNQSSAAQEAAGKSATNPVVKTQIAAQVLSIMTNGESVMGQQTMATQPEGQPSLPGENINKTIMNLMKTLVDILVLDPREDVSALGQKLQNGARSETEVIRALQILSEIGNDEKLLKIEPLLKEVSQRVEVFEKELSGQHLFNNVSKASEMPSYYLSFPVKMGEEYQLCEMTINKDGNKKWENADQLRLVVSLHTMQLGIVLFHVEWTRRGDLKLQGLVQNQAICDHMSSKLGVLVENLEKLGYRVQNLGMRVRRTEEIEILKPQLVQDNKIQTLGIDVTI